LEIFEFLNSKFGMASCYSSLGSFYSEQNDFEASLENNRKALKIFEDLENIDAVASTLSEIGIVLTKMGHYEDAYHNLTESLKIAIEIGFNVRELDSYQGLYEYYEATRNYKTSLEYYKTLYQCKR
jgi:tetratricopeptide (TPR) repeat protein